MNDLEKRHPAYVAGGEAKLQNTEQVEQDNSKQDLIGDARITLSGITALWVYGITLRRQRTDWFVENLQIFNKHVFAA